MANGPMGGFMPTPAAPAQPPQVKLDTTATSRGNFSTFLKNMNGATSLNPPSMAPSVGANSPLVAPTMSDIDIFNPPVQMMQEGGFAGSPLASYGDFLSKRIDNTQVQPFIEEIEQMAKQRFNLNGSGSGTGGGGLTSTPAPPQLTSSPGVSLPPTQNLKPPMTNTRPGSSEMPIFTPSNPFQDLIFTRPEPAIATRPVSIFDRGPFPKVSQQPEIIDDPIFGDSREDYNFTYEDAMSRNAQRDVKSPAEQAAIDAAIAKGPSGLGPINIEDDLKGFLDAYRDPQFIRRLEPDMDERTQLLRRPEGFANGGDVDYSGFEDAFGPSEDFGTSDDGQEDTSDSFDENMGLSQEFADALTSGSDIFSDDPRENTLGVFQNKNLASQLQELDRRPLQLSGGIMSKIPSFVTTGLNFAEQKAKDFILSDLASGNFDPIYDSQGRITGSRDRVTGAVRSGMDFNAPLDLGGDADEPVIKPLVLKKEEEKKDDLPPNVIGGMPISPEPPVGFPPIELDPLPVVPSPFAPATSKIEPIGFDSGELNKLIELLTGVPAKPIVSAKEGGLIKAVDDFLATGT